MEVIPLVSMIDPKIASFLETHIIYQFGIPVRIITDNGASLKNQHMRRICNTYKIKYSFLIPYFPQGNKQAEATNKMIIIILKKTIKDNH